MAAERLVYELWDLDTNNAIASFSTQRDAAMFVRKLFAKESASYLEQLVLLEVNRFGHSKDLARGHDELNRFQSRGGAVSAR